MALPNNNQGFYTGKNGIYNNGHLFTSTELAFSLPTCRTEKDIIFGIIEKITAGGMKQLLYSLKSEDKTEAETAKLLLGLIKSCEQNTK